MKMDILSEVKILSIFIIFLFVFLALGAAKFSGKNIPQGLIAPSPSLAPAIDTGNANEKELIAVKKYQNEKYGFELEYSGLWMVDSGDAADVFIQPRIKKTSNLPIPHEDALEIKAISAGIEADLEKLAAEYREDGIDFTSEKIEIGDVPGLKITTRICRADNCRITEWFAVKNGYLYHLSSIYPDTSYNRYFDQIISSIKFSAVVE